MSESTFQHAFSSDPEEVAYRAEQEPGICADPGRDYFSQFPPLRPKLGVGSYVREHGFEVPIIDSLEEWQEAYDEGVAMIRSDSPQDYSGFSGLLDSVVLKPERIFGFYRGYFGKIHPKIEQAMTAGLRNLDMNPEAYMRIFHWQRNNINTLDVANSLGIEIQIDEFATASLWRYIDGVNLRIFRDPHVDERYYVGTDMPYEAGWMVSPGEGIKLPESETTLDVDELVEFYEGIRTLPRFDRSQVPVIEAQRDKNGHYHFLQYLKTGHKLDLKKAFPLPQLEGGIYSDNVRGVTDPSGQEMKLYVGTNRMTRHMQGQGFYVNEHASVGLKTQLICHFAGTVIQPWFISFKDNHYNSSPLYRPRIAMGLAENFEAERKLRELEELGEQGWKNPHPTGNLFVKARLISNGREAVLTVDPEPQIEPYGHCIET